MDALVTLSFSVTSQTTGKASSAVFACHQVSATTATASSPTCTTFFTPFILATLAASKLFTLLPVFGNKVKSFDAAKVANMKGVKKAVQVGDDAVAVVADTWWHAKTALDALPVVWEVTENDKVTSASIGKWLKEGLDAEQAFVGNQNGDAKAGLAKAAKKVTAEYGYPYQNHATMEPMN